mmetsp:Transcript_31706/g.91033  ORF Transcript_31706/g.91033 Transcript_31706/m.91033 type:complete len:202 (+) Transcript_31706:616-1221(+)
MQWQPRLWSHVSCGCMRIASATSWRMLGTSSSGQRSASARTQSPSTSSSRMSMTVQKTASTTSSDCRPTRSSRRTKGSPETAPRHQKQYFVRRRCPCMLRIWAATTSQSPTCLKPSRQQAFIRARRPSVSTAFSEISESVELSILRALMSSDSAASSAPTCRGSAWGARACTTPQMAVKHFRRHRTCALPSCIRCRICSRP